MNKSVKFMPPVRDLPNQDRQFGSVMLLVEPKYAASGPLGLTSVTITWQKKVQEAKQEVRRELDRPKVGRKARRNGTTEHLEPDDDSLSPDDIFNESQAKKEPEIIPAFPASGGLKYDKFWYALTEKHAQRIQGGHLPDTSGIATAFRDFCTYKGIKLGEKNIDKIFVSFVSKYRPLMR